MVFAVLASLFLLVCTNNNLGVLSLRPPLPMPEKTSAPSSSSSSVTFSRRQWMIGAAVATTAVSSQLRIDPANAEPSLISKLQSPIQDVIAPGHWIGQFAGLNSRQETWKFPKNSPEQVSKALIDVLKGLSDEGKSDLYMPEFDIKQADATNVHVLAWTKLEWLDSLDVKLEESTIIKNGKTTSDGCVAKATFYATGFLPTNIPGAPLLNVAMAWFPFASPGPRGEMLQAFRLRTLKGLVTNKLKEHTVTPDLYV